MQFFIAQFKRCFGSLGKLLILNAIVLVFKNEVSHCCTTQQTCSSPQLICHASKNAGTTNAACKREMKWTCLLLSRIFSRFGRLSIFGQSFFIRKCSSCCSQQEKRHFLNGTMAYTHSPENGEKKACTQVERNVKAVQKWNSAFYDNW